MAIVNKKIVKAIQVVLELAKEGLIKKVTIRCELIDGSVFDTEEHVDR